MTGVVTEFDDAAGYGTVRTDDGRELFFHCTQILDGSRTMDVGADVDYEVVPGRHGQWEAAEIRSS